MGKLYNIADSLKFKEAQFEALHFFKDGVSISGVDAIASVAEERRYELQITTPELDEPLIFNFSTATQLRSAFGLATQLAEDGCNAEKFEAQLSDRLYPKE